MSSTKLDEGIIEDVSASTMAYINRRMGIWYYSVGILLIVVAIYGAYYTQEIDVVALPLIWFIGWYGHAHTKTLQTFMIQFASVNKFDYSEGHIVDMDGALFERGHTKQVSNMVAGVFNHRQMRFFNYQFSLGGGRSRRSYNYTVCEIALPGTAPNILVESKNFFDFNSFKKRHQKEMPLESGFQEHFEVYAPEDFDIETFEIFTPEIMTSLIDIAKGYDFEFIRNRLYIFRQGTISKRLDLHALLLLAKYLITTLMPRLIRLEDDIAAIHAVRKR